MTTLYALETIAHQRIEETARNARTAYQRQGIETRPRWRFPRVSFPTRRPSTFVPRPV